MDGVVSIWWRTAEPTRPVAPVSMRCIFGFVCTNEEGKSVICGIETGESIVIMSTRLMSGRKPRISACASDESKARVSRLSNSASASCSRLVEFNN